MPCKCGAGISDLVEYLREAHYVVSKVKGFTSNIYGELFIDVNYHTTKYVDDSEISISKYYECSKCGAQYNSEKEVIETYGKE